MTNAELFRVVFSGLMATELWAKPESEFLEWLNAEAIICNRWISVKDGLPVKKNDYLIYNTNGTVSIYWYDPVVDQWFDDLGFRTESVTHWMLIPEPPKE